jgi:anti-sigma-K factor RskA
LNNNDIISSGLLELYVMGQTTSEETEQIQNLEKNHPEIANEIKAIEDSLQNYAMLNAIEPNSNVKAKLFSQINFEDENNHPKAKIVEMPLNYSKPSQFWKMAAAAAVFLLIGSSILNYVYYNKYNDTAKNLDQTKQQLIAANTNNESMENTMGIIQSKYSEPVKLSGLPASPNSVAKVFWMKNTGEVYLDPSNLPAAPNGKQYQFWAIVNGKPVDGGLINSGAKAQIQKMKTFGRVEAFAITLETAGGNPTPKGEMYVMGKL